MHLVFNTSYSWLIKLFRKAHKDVKLCLQLLCQHLTPMMALSIFMATSRIFWSSSGTPSRAMDVLWKSRCWRTVYTISGSPVLTASCKTGRHKSEIWPPCILTFWQIPKPLWKVSNWIKGQYSLQSGTQAAAPPDRYDHDYLLLALTWLRREENIALLASWANPTIVPFPRFLTTGSEILTVSSELAFTVWSHNCGDGQVGFVLCISLLSQLKITLRVILRVWECAKQVKCQDFTGKYYYFQL